MSPVSDRGLWAGDGHRLASGLEETGVRGRAMSSVLSMLRLRCVDTMMSRRQLWSQTENKTLLLQ